MRAIIAVILVVLSGCLGSAWAVDFDGDSRSDLTVFRPASGLWAIRGITRVYFGRVSDSPRPGDYTGDGIAEIAIFRPGSGLWAVRGVTRAYFGQSGDEPIAGGGGQRAYDYVVRPDDSDDLLAALESEDFDSVFIPAGNYHDISEPIDVTHVTRIVGEEIYTTLWLEGANYLNIASYGCRVEGIRVRQGGHGQYGNFYIDNSRVTVRDCTSMNSSGNGFTYSSNALDVSLINCVAWYAATSGFSGVWNLIDSRLSSCVAIKCGEGGFFNCHNLSTCIVEGEETTGYGFRGCETVSACRAIECVTRGFWNCMYLSSCVVDGLMLTGLGFDNCHNLSSCHAEVAAAGVEYNACFNFSTGPTGSCD